MRGAGVRGWGNSGLEIRVIKKFKEISCRNSRNKALRNLEHVIKNQNKKINTIW